MVPQATSGHNCISPGLVYEDRGLSVDSQWYLQNEWMLSHSQLDCFEGFLTDSEKLTFTETGYIALSLSKWLFPGWLLHCDPNNKPLANAQEYSQPQ